MQKPASRSVSEQPARPRATTQFRMSPIVAEWTFTVKLSTF
jgi:hypothetical protein